MCSGLFIGNFVAVFDFKGYKRSTAFTGRHRFFSFHPHLFPDGCKIYGMLDLEYNRQYFQYRHVVDPVC